MGYLRCLLITLFDEFIVNFHKEITDFLAVVLIVMILEHQRPMNSVESLGALLNCGADDELDETRLITTCVIFIP